MAKSAAAANGGSGICCVVGSALPIIHMLRVYLGEWTSGLPAVLCRLFARLFAARVLDRRPIRAIRAESKTLGERVGEWKIFKLQHAMQRL